MIEALGGIGEARDLLAGVELIAATDVEHPLLGPMGAAQVFGPQKGADPDTVAVLERRLTEWAAELDAAAGRAVSEEPGAGAAGGLGAGLLALGGRRESGAAVIAEHTRLADDVADAELVITGEGRFDDQSLHGKVVSALAAGGTRHTCAGTRRPGHPRRGRPAGRGNRRRIRHRRPRRIGPAGHRRRGEPAHRFGAGHGRPTRE